MKKILAGFFISFCIVNVFGQKTKTESKTNIQVTKSSLTAKKQLENAVLKSTKATKVRVTFETNIQNKEITSTFEHLAPNRFYLLEKISGKVNKEIIEIGNQQFRKKDEKWTKIKMDFYSVTLKEQFDIFFPIKLSSKKGDYATVKRAEVNLIGEEVFNESKCRKYRYSVSYKELDSIDSGVAWINESSGLLERLETEGGGLFGQLKTVWNYFYDKEIKIEMPKDFIEEN